MAELEDKLGAILNNPQAMSQIMSLARSLNGGGQDQSPVPEAEALPYTEATADMEPVAEAQETPFSFPVGDLDPRLMEVGMRALAAYRSQDNRQAALLQALRPFVRSQRYAKVDKAIQIARLSKVIRAALDALKGGEANV